MKKKRSWFKLYPQDPQATNLSIAGGAARLLAILLLAAAVLLVLAALAEGIHFMADRGHGNALLHLLDEMDDELGTAFLLGCGAAICGYAAHVLRCKAELLHPGDPALEE